MPGAERRQQLLSTARAMILREGLSAVTMSALADAVGVTKPIVYKHFSNREDVAVAVLQDYFTGAAEFSLDRIRGSRTIFEYLNASIDSVFEYIGREGPLIRNMTTGFSSTSAIDACYREEVRVAHQIYTDLLLQQSVSPDVADLAAFALMEMVNQTALEFSRPPNEKAVETLKAMVAGALKVLIEGQGVAPRIPDVLVSAIANRYSVQSSR